MSFKLQTQGIYSINNNKFNQQRFNMGINTKVLRINKSKSRRTTITTATASRFTSKKENEPDQPKKEKTLIDSKLGKITKTKGKKKMAYATMTFLSSMEVEWAVTNHTPTSISVAVNKAEAEMKVMDDSDEALCLTATQI